MGTTDDLKRDDRIGRWVIRERIGAGGMGTVYRAVDTHLHREVALKTLVPERVAEASDIPAEEILDRFRREAQAVARVRHPNVLEVISYEVVEGRSIIEMELLEGETLGKLLRKGALGMERTLEILLPVCAAVAACHEQGIIHRDLKPGNIFLAERAGRRAGDRRKVEVVKVLDFGVSKVTIANNELTQAQRLLGTPNYMAPEQVRGQADERSDQYAIGVLLYHCLIGRPPYAALRDRPQALLLSAVQSGTFPRPRERRPELPEALEGVILRAMSLEPAARFGSVDELGRQLVPHAAPAVAEEWSEYFLEETPRAPIPVSSLPNSLIGGRIGDGSTIKDLVDPPDRFRTGASGTISERDIATAADRRFTATTVATPSLAPGASIAVEGPRAHTFFEPDSKVEAAQTPWSVSDAAQISKTELVGARRRLVQGGIALGVLSLVGGGLWLASPGTPPPAPPAAAAPTVVVPVAAHPAPLPVPSPALTRAPEARQEVPAARPDAAPTNVAAPATESTSAPADADQSSRKTRRKRSSTQKQLGAETAPDGVIILAP
jgi:serine/threonine-protein kinase